MLSATNGVAGSGKKPRKSRGKGLRTNTGWYVNKYTIYTSTYPALAIMLMEIVLAVASDGSVLIRQ